MAARNVPHVVLDEADDVLREVGDWLRLSPYCPNCLSLSGCSHEAGCPLGRVARLRCLLGSDDQQRRGDALVALRRERGELTSEGDQPSPPVLTLTSAAPELPMGTPARRDPSAPTHADQSVAPLVCVLDDAPSHGSNDPIQSADRDRHPDVLVQVEAVDDERARAFVIETLQLAGTRCFAEASAMRGDTDRAGTIRANAAALCNLAGHYAEAAAGWLIRNGKNALLGQGALLDDRPAATAEGAPR